MKTSRLFSISSHNFLLVLLSYSVLLLLSISFAVSLSFDWYSTCKRRFSCGELTDLGYPFLGNGRISDCGHPKLELYCKNEITHIDIMDVTYAVMEVDEKAQTLSIVPADLSDLTSICSTDKFANTVLDTQMFEYAPGYGEITILYNCSKQITSPLNYSCSSRDMDVYAVRSGAIIKGAESCSRLGVGGDFRIFNYSYFGKPWYYNSWEFQVKYKVDTASCGQCTRSGGACGYYSNLNQTTCFCPNEFLLSYNTCPASTTTTPSDPDMPVAPTKDKKGQSSKRNWAIGISVALLGITLVLFVVCYSKRNLLAKSMVFSKNDKKDEFDVEAFIKRYGSFAPKRYSYSNVKKMTNSFAEKVGKGGYGAVFKGNLPDGRLVAVKLLSNSKGNGEEFINEVASIGKTSHINVVTLLGFCYERNKRALIYEYMPNGSLDKFIFNRRSMDADCRLEWKTLYEISVGIARGLEYLHRGCNTRILHFDIKPHNILLDKNFCPKISDFGLAKLCQMDESVVSMLGARGTAGYIAPEVFCRNLGGVSYRSDVYSYGMMILEMVGGRKNIDAEVSRTSEIYFPDWLRKHVEDENLKLNEVLSTEDEELVRKMIVVSLWCTQTMPSDRPSMTKVVEMLEGSLDSLKLPPKSLSSATGLPVPSS